MDELVSEHILCGVAGAQRVQRGQTGIFFWKVSNLTWMCSWTQTAAKASARGVSADKNAPSSPSPSPLLLPLPLLEEAQQLLQFWNRNRAFTTWEAAFQQCRCLSKTALSAVGMTLGAKGVNPELLVYTEESWGRQLEPENNSEFECLLKKEKERKENC